MRIKKYRYFFIFMTAQEKWLNKMASNGYRLINTTKLAYEFETCDKDEYEYCIEYIGNKSYKDIVEYQSFLEQMGYKTFTKNLNINYSYGKIAWRPTGKQWYGQFSTSPGSYNKEFLIIEKRKDDKPFNIYSNYQDLINYYKPLRNMSISFLIIYLLLFVLGSVLNILSFNLFAIVILLSLAFLSTIQIVIYTLKINQYKKLNNINE